MQRFIPNTVLYDRFLLKEELSYESQTGQQVWTVQDRQTGQSLIARLHTDGRIEWFNDNRISTPVAPVIATPEPRVVEPVIAPKPALQVPNTVPQAPSGGKRAFLFLLVLLLIGGLLGAYFYHKPLLTYLQSLRSPAIVRTDSTAQPVADKPATPVETESSKLPTWEPATSTPVALNEPTPENIAGTNENITPDALPSTPISVPQALRMLNLLKQISAEKHPAIFRDARQAFTDLRQQPSRQASIDSLYAMCTGRGAQSFLAHQQNGDPISKRYAIEWYQLAYALKPSAYLDERLNRLRGNARSAQRKSSAPTKKPRESLFMRDPEVNR